MPMNYSMFNKRADQDPEASQKTGLAKFFAGWRLMLKDDGKTLRGETSVKENLKNRKDLM
jgi:hypothetical protein